MSNILSLQFQIFIINYVTLSINIPCLLTPNIHVFNNKSLNNGFDISDPNDLNIKFINPKQAIETFSFLEIIPGFKAFNKNYLDYLSLAKVTQILPTFASSLKNSSTVTKSPFIPFAKI